MDFIVSYHLYSKLKKKELKESLKEHEKKKELIKINNNDLSMRDIISKTCDRCGQDPYLCQCSNNMKLVYHKFNPEKDNY